MLETKDLVIKKAEQKDWRDMYHNLWCHSESAKHMLWNVTTSEEAAQARMERTITFQATHEYQWNVYEKKSGQAIGFAGLEQLEEYVYGETGIAIGPAFTRRGYGKQILDALVEFARDELGAKRFVASCRSANEASKGLILSCGFSYSHSEEKVDARNGERYMLEYYFKESRDMSYKIISGQYELGTKEQQAGYKMLFGEENIQYKFDLYFHWYNIVHEVGHCVIDAQEISMSRVQEEMFVNEFAVAYWKHIGEENRIRELENMLKEIMANIPSPVPNDVSFAEYYESIWGEEVFNNVMLYGYFQLNSVMEAIKGNKDLKTVLESIGIDLKSDVVMSMYDGAICAESANRVLSNVVTNINKLDINPIQISIELVDNPMIQCAQ